MKMFTPEYKSLNESEEDNGNEMHSGVKSTAIVKYASTDMPARYHELQPNTNLNNPPSNWLFGNSKWESYIKNVSLCQGHSFSSFPMAHCYLDLTGEIDVVSDAENIKKLLKMPFSKASISMMVHRVGNTLMLDDFDIHRHLLRQQEDDWKWLRKFFYETVLNNVDETQREKWIARKNKSRDHLQNRNMFSKFLYYSVVKDSKPEDCLSLNSIKQPETDKTTTENSSEPPHERNPGGLEHQRTVVWTFEDIRMLIGTDLAIFGGGTHPCLSLRLRDMKKPINVLSGLDYWLDNLMCNVPELAMCYHDNGIVQSYELIKTEDIPNLSDSRFSPTVVKDIAQNILSFLKSNATKEGHTYWLFKGHDDDVVKLYDLTTLCSHLMDDQSANPFTVPVGVLLYRVARNMWIGQKCNRKKMNIIHTLFQDCLKLLDTYKHSQLVISAHYLLSDLYVSDGIENDGEAQEGSSEDSDTDEQEQPESMPEDEEKAAQESTQDSSSSVEVNTLCVHETSKTKWVDNSLLRYPPIEMDTVARCRSAISHIAQGLKILKESGEATSSCKNIIEEQVHCDPNTAIPLYYQPLNTDISLAVSTRTVLLDSLRSSCNSEDDFLQCSQSCSTSASSWQFSSQTLLLRKAAITFYRLAKTEMAAENLILGLKYTAKSLYCFAAVKQQLKGKAEKNMTILASILCLCGDIYFSLGHDKGELSTTKFDFMLEADGDDEGVIMALAEERMVTFEYQSICEFSIDSEENLMKSIQSYAFAHDCLISITSDPQRLKQIVKRQGNVQNELGAYYMNQSAILIDDGKDYYLHEVQKLFTKSLENFKAATGLFKCIGDDINTALIHANNGRLLRLRAHGVRLSIVANSTPQQREFSMQEKSFFEQAIACYENALKLIGSYESCPAFFNSFSWELSGVYFNMGTLLQDYAPISTIAQQNIEKEIVVNMHNALDHCKGLATRDFRNELAASYRSAVIHHRLASMYHNAFRNEAEGQRKRKFLDLARSYYEESAKCYGALDSSLEMIRVQLERVTLCEYLLSNQTSYNSRMRTLNEVLGYILDCIPALDFIILQLRESCTSNDEAVTQNSDALNLVQLLESRLQDTLKSLTMCARTPDKRVKHQMKFDLFKSLYAKSLSVLPPEKKDIAFEVAQHQRNILKEIEQTYNPHASQDS